jgi:hypothetical protein
MLKLASLIRLLKDKIFNHKKLGARTDNSWNDRGTYLEPSASLGQNILIKGTNKYVNFNAISGSSGYGIRDNNGVLEMKVSGGAWINLVGIAFSDTAPADPYINMLWIDTTP